MKIKTLFNKKKRELKRGIGAALALLLVFGITSESYASNATIRDAEKKVEEAEENLEEMNNQIGSIESRQASLRKEMDAIGADLANCVLNITLLEAEQEQTHAELVEVNARLKDAKATEAEEYDSMKKRIRYMYENGENSVWSALLSAHGISDFLNKMDYVSSVYTHDRNLLEKYRGTVQEVKDLKNDVKEEEAELEEIEVELKSQQELLEQTLAQKEAENEDVSAQLVSAKALANQYAATIAEQNEVIRAEQKRIEEEKARKKAEEEAKKKQEEDKKKAEEERKKYQEQAAANNNNGSSATNTDPDDGGGSAGESSYEEGGTSSGGGGGGLNPGYTTGISGQAVVDYACQFIGCPYVYGGTSLTEGCDCSGFTMGVFAHFGISLPRTSYEQSQVGQAVSYENAQPGDICYYTGHVGIYMGGGMIVNASTPATGIKTQSATYRPIVTIRRVL